VIYWRVQVGTSCSSKVCSFICFLEISLPFVTGRLDAVVFSGGLGENSPELRRAVIQRCACLGLDHISETMNMKGGHGEDVIFDIGQGVRQPRTLVCNTNEAVCLIIIVALLYSNTHPSSKSHDSVYSKMNTGRHNGQRVQEHNTAVDEVLICLI
jgi:acetate kinase